MKPQTQMQVGLGEAIERHKNGDIALILERERIRREEKQK